MMPRATTAVLAGLSAAAIAGCGSSGYAPTGLTTAPGPAAETPVRSVGPARMVTMRGLAFLPRTIRTTVGRGVEWINRDDVRHNVTGVDGATVASPDLGPGGRFVYVPARPGRLRYYCTIHPSTMSGVLIVDAG